MLSSPYHTPLEPTEQTHQAETRAEEWEGRWEGDDSSSSVAEGDLPDGAR